MECGAGAFVFIIPFRFNPDRTTMRFENAARNWQTQARAATFELRLATGVQFHAPKLPKFLKYNSLVFSGYADACIRHDHFDEAGQFPAVNSNFSAIWRVFDGVVDHV